VRDGLRQSDRIADREHDVADALSWSERPKVVTGSGVKIDLQDGQVRVRIAADDVRVGHAAVRELHA
jgi:hypothetical protein